MLWKALPSLRCQSCTLLSTLDQKDFQVFKKLYLGGNYAKMLLFNLILFDI